MCRSRIRWAMSLLARMAVLAWMNAAFRTIIRARCRRIRMTRSSSGSKGETLRRRRTRIWTSSCRTKWTTRMRTASGILNFKGKETAIGRAQKTQKRPRNRTCSCSGSRNTRTSRRRAASKTTRSGTSHSTAPLLGCEEAIAASNSNLDRRSGPQGTRLSSKRSTTPCQSGWTAPLRRRRRASPVSHLSTAAIRKTEAIPIPITRPRAPSLTDLRSRRRTSRYWPRLRLKTIDHHKASVRLTELRPKEANQVGRLPEDLAVAPQRSRRLPRSSSLLTGSMPAIKSSSRNRRSSWASVSSTRWKRVNPAGRGGRTLATAHSATTVPTNRSEASRRRWRARFSWLNREHLRRRGQITVPSAEKWKRAPTASQKSVSSSTRST